MATPRITIQLHDAMDGALGSLLEKCVNEFASAGCAVTIEGKPWEIASEAGTPDQPGFAVHRGGTIAMCMVDGGARRVRA